MKEVASLIKRHIDGSISVMESKALTRWRQKEFANEIFFQKVISSSDVYIDALLWIELENGNEKRFKEEIKQRVFRKISR